MTIGNETKLEKERKFFVELIASEDDGVRARTQATHPAGQDEGAGEMPLQPIPLPQL